MPSTKSDIRSQKRVKPVPLSDYVEHALNQAKLQPDETGFIATVPSLPGCLTWGATEQEALESLRDAIEAWVLTGLRFGDPIPPINHTVPAYSVDKMSS